MKSTVVRSRCEAVSEGGKAFVSSTGSVSVGSGDINLGLFKPGTGKVTRITRMIFSADNTRRFRLTVDPTITSDGTEQSAQNRRIGKGQTNVSKLYKSPTTSAEGNLCYDFWVNPATPVILNFKDNPWIFDPGKNLLIMTSGGDTQNASLAIEWDEEPQ